jgi:hypothetical protein
VNATARAAEWQREIGRGAVHWSWKRPPDEARTVYEHFRRIELQITIEEFHHLPRNSAYKYEYFDDRAILTPRPKIYNAARDLSPPEYVDDIDVRPLPASEILGLTDLFTHAFAQTQPFQSLGREASAAACRSCLEKTASGGDGPLVEAACFQAFEPEREKGPVGAILITLQPEGILTDPHCHGWREPPPADAVARRMGCPHLTWVFVSWWRARHGIATALLAETVRVLAGVGYTDLASTFLLGNDPSTLWHWANGFRVVPLYGAWRREQWARGRDGG